MTTAEPELRSRPLVLDEWYEDNKALFAPPVCNKLMHRDQLTVMFVGGPNTRTDFHLDLGSEFFYQIKGNMSLPTIQRGKRKVVHIREGQVFLLPSRVPHSPQREAGGLGLVVERKREDGELDGLRWYQDFEQCGERLYERHFQCYDLGRDLVPVVQKYKASEEHATGQTKADSVPADPPFGDNSDVDVPDPFNLADFLDTNEESLARGADLELFPGNPDGEFSIRVIGGPSTQTASCAHDTFFFQLQGRATVETAGKQAELITHSCYVVPPMTEYTVIRDEGSVGLVVTQDPAGNR